MNGAPNGWTPPSWVKSLVYAILQLGETRMFALVAMGILILFAAASMGWINSPLLATQALLVRHIEQADTKMDDLILTMKQLAQGMSVYNSEQTRLLRRLCIQEANSMSEREKCLE